MNQPQQSDNILPEEAAQFHTFAYFVSIDDATNRQRFYRLDWHEALWGGGAVIRSWGRIGGKGRKLTTFYPDRVSAQDLIERMVKRRIRRGYQLLELL